MTIWHDLLGLEFQVKHVDAKGIKTRALIAGEGEDVIMMHGTSAVSYTHLTLPTIYSV